VNGVTECENPAGQAFGGARLDAVIAAAGVGGTPGNAAPYSIPRR